MTPRAHTPLTAPRCPSWSLLWLCLALAGLHTACAARPQLPDPPPPTRGQLEAAAEAARTPSSPQLEPGIYRVDTGEPLSREVFYDRLTAARFVVIGESHDDAFHHQVQRDVYEGLAARTATSVALGMEMFQSPAQGALDDYVSGKLSEAELLKAAEWETRWGYPSSFYAPMWQLAASRGWAVWALNAPRELTRRISQVGVDGLDAQERAQLPELDLKLKAHRDWMLGIFTAHGMATDEATFNRFYQAQVTWDETMAQRAFEAMLVAPPEAQLVVLAGSGHVMHRWGIPSRIERRLVASGQPEDAAREQVVTLIPISSPGARRTLHSETAVTEDDLARWRAEAYADYIWVE